MPLLLCIPFLNGEKQLPALLEAISIQTLQPDIFLAIDSGSNDRTLEILEEAGVRIFKIRRQEFDHGGTRQMAVDMYPSADIVLFLTHDAIPAHPQAFEELIACFRDASVGAAYGRQLPRHGANPIEAHARYFNYPPTDKVKRIDDSKVLGIKTAFISNSFAAYRRIAMQSVGGFPKSTICTEDTHLAARLLLAGWNIAYSAHASVYHSHNYSFADEFRRYYDIGYFYGRESWIGDAFGGTGKEGIRFVNSELQYLLHVKPQQIPYSLFRTACKLFGYRLGSHAERHPLFLRRFLSMNKLYWR